MVLEGKLKAVRISLSPIKIFVHKGWFLVPIAETISGDLGWLMIEPRMNSRED
jgi:hypothetical protein